jgi:ADP-ribosylglycohydrolase
VVYLNYRKRIKERVIVMKLTSEQADRAAGVLVGTAVGDALGVPYEFQPLEVVGAPGFVPAMIGGGLGPYAPGEWSDDTQMTMCIANALSNDADPLTTEGLDQIAVNFLDWESSGATDIGAQTRRVLEVTDAWLDMDPAQHPSTLMTRVAAKLHADTGRSAGNGALMRTAPIALRYLDDPEKMTAAAIAISKLTHFDDLASEACVIWCSAIRSAVLDGDSTGIILGVNTLPGSRQDFWRQVLAEASRRPPNAFPNNGYVVTALQAAWSAIHRSYHSSTPINEVFETGVINAVKAGNDTDTVAAIAGSLLGGLCGHAAIPVEWEVNVNGWPNASTATTLRQLAMSLVEM